MRVIPAIDLIGGKCVRLYKGDYSQVKTYADNPPEVARAFEQDGFTHLHVVDLDGARSGGIKQWKTLEDIRKSCSMKIDFGGGMKTAEDIRIAFESGADQVTLGTIAARNRDVVLSMLEQYGPEKLILGADAKDEIIAVSGWHEATQLPVIEFISDYAGHGFKSVISTDVSVDGTLEGPSLNLYKGILERVDDIELIASGGVGTLEHLVQLKELGVDGVIVGKAIYEQTISPREILSIC